MKVGWKREEEAKEKKKKSQSKFLFLGYSLSEPSNCHIILVPSSDDNYTYYCIGPLPLQICSDGSYAERPPFQLLAIS